MKSPAKGILRWFFGDALKELEVSSVPNPYDTPLYWLVNRDPYNGLLKSLYNIYITGSYNPLYKTTNLSDLSGPSRSNGRADASMPQTDAQPL